MKQLSRTHLLIVAVLTVFTEAQVSLEYLDELQNSFICGKHQFLKCTIEPYSGIMTWTKDTYLDPLASCTPSDCAVNPSMSASYNFTFYTDNGTFYMEILTVTVADNSTTYSCANGFVSASVTSNVNVEDNYSIVKNSESIDSDTTKVSCTTGCIKNKTLEAVQFKWWFQEVNNTDSEKKKINESESNTNYDSSVCMTNPNCGVLGYSYATNVINITNEENGKNYSLGVDITSGGNLIKSVYYDLFFTRNFPDPEFPICNGNECVLGITTAYLIIFVTEMSMCIYGRYVYSSDKQRGEKLWFAFTTFSISFALSLPLIGLFVKGALVIKRMKSDHLPILKCWHLGLILAASFICELFIILLCIVWCFCQWYALLFVFPDLIIGWIMFIIIFYKDKDETSSSAAVPTLSFRRISLLCMSLFVWVFGLCWCDRPNTDIKQTEKTTPKKGHHVSNLSPEPEQKVESNEKPVGRSVTGNTQLKKNDVVMNKHAPLPPIGSSDITRSRQLHKNEAVTEKHSPLARNEDRSLPGSHESSRSTMTRGISAVTFPDVKDDMALGRRQLKLYPGTLHTIPQHWTEDHSNHVVHHNHDVQNNHEVHSNHDEHHHHHLSEEGEMQMKQLKQISDEARAAGKHVEWKQDKLYINNCLYHLYHQEDHHNPTYSNTTKDFQRF